MTNNERVAREILGLIHWEEYELDLEACFRMEEKIKEKGWEKDYVRKLVIVTGLCSSNSMTQDGILTGYRASYFDLIHASPKDRVEAAIRMLDERGKYETN